MKKEELDRAQKHLVTMKPEIWLRLYAARLLEVAYAKADLDIAAQARVNQARAKRVTDKAQSRSARVEAFMKSMPKKGVN